jgi:hypothetical protein
MDDKVMVTSMVNGTISVLSLNRRVWSKKGQKLPVKKDTLREAIYNPGVEYMFKNGILYIDDMDFKIELGLEPEGAKTPTQIIPMDDKYLNRVLKLMPISEMKKVIDSMTLVQKQELVDYAAHQSDVALDRIRVVSEKCGVDVLKSIELNRQKEE